MNLSEFRKRTHSTQGRSLVLGGVCAYKWKKLGCASSRKAEVISSVLGIVCQHFHVVSMQVAIVHAQGCHQPLGTLYPRLQRQASHFTESISRENCLLLVSVEQGYGVYLNACICPKKTRLCKSIYWILTQTPLDFFSTNSLQSVFHL